MLRLARAIFPLILTLGTTVNASALDGVVASIKPVHSLVAAVMGQTGIPALLVQGANSPHGFTMKPSQASLLAHAKLVFWIGHELETFLEKPVETIANHAESVELLDTQGLTRLAPREGGTFEPDADDGDAHDHGHGGIDPHLWLDPENAKLLVDEIERTLSAADPANASTYRTNAQATIARLDALAADVRQTLAPAKGRGFVVFHDAFQYFENRFDIRAAGSVTINPDVAPSAARIAAIHAKLADLDAACIFTEPQFEPRLIPVITEGTDARTGILDPLGTDLKDGPDLYFQLIGNLAGSLRNCLGGNS